jgi:hypothetical protein
MPKFVLIGGTHDGERHELSPEGRPLKMHEIEPDDIKRERIRMAANCQEAEDQRAIETYLCHRIHVAGFAGDTLLTFYALQGISDVDGIRRLIAGYQSA